MSFCTKVGATAVAAGIAVGAFTAVGAVTGGIPAAGAATAPCAGYSYTAKSAIQYPLRGGAHKTVGYVYWYQKSYAHSPTRVCAVTKPTSTYVGKTSYLYINLGSGSPSVDVRDGGNYHYYAGPVVVARTGPTSVFGEVTLKPAYGGQTYTTNVDI